MNIKFKLLLLLPLVVCTGRPHHELRLNPKLSRWLRDARGLLPSLLLLTGEGLATDVGIAGIQSFMAELRGTSNEAMEPQTPYIDKLGSLMSNILLFMLYTGSVNYDAYFVVPALMSLEESEFSKNGFLKFFAEDFRLDVHAKGFHFSKTETREEFAKRFFGYIANAENVPLKTRELAAKFSKHFEMRPLDADTRGSIFPCPLYSFVRAVTFLREGDKLRDVDENKIEVIIKFLLEEFNPVDYNIEDNAHVYDIGETVGHGLGGDRKPLTLTDGTLASQRNKELFELLLTKESVPQIVKDAIREVLPHM